MSLLLHLQGVESMSKAVGKIWGGVRKKHIKGKKEHSTTGKEERFLGCSIRRAETRKITLWAASKAVHRWGDAVRMQREGGCMGR